MNETKEMTVDDIKKFQVKLGIAIEATQRLGLVQTVEVLSEAMDMSAQYERLVQKIDQTA